MKTQKHLQEMSDAELEARREDLYMNPSPRWHRLDGPALFWSIVLTVAGGIVFACGGGAAVAAAGASTFLGAAAFTAYTCRHHAASRRELLTTQEEISRRSEERVDMQQKRGLTPGVGNDNTSLRERIGSSFDLAAASTGSNPDPAGREPQKSAKANENRGPRQ